jgi:hypothetical protein
MRVRPYVVPALAATLVLSGPLLGYAAGRRSPLGAPHKAHHVYRLDYAVSVAEPGKPVQISTYTMSVEDGSSGNVHAGASIPLVSSSSPSPSVAPRQDVGLALRCHLTRLGDHLLMQTTTEISGPDDGVEPGPRAIRKITANDDVIAPLGKPTVVASVQEPVSHSRYEVTVTATKLW